MISRLCTSTAIVFACLFVQHCAPSSGGGQSSPVSAPVAAPAQDETSPKEENGFVSCSGKVVDYDPEYFFCDYPYVAEGETHSQGNYPLVTLQITTPEHYKDRQVSILCRYGNCGGVIDRSGFGVGHICEIELPKDFLSGDYKTVDVGDTRDFRLADGDSGDASVEEP